MIKAIRNRPILSYLLLLIIPIIGLAVGVGLGFVFGLNEQPTGNLLVNVAFLLAVVGLIPIFKFSTEEMGLKLLTSRLGFHIAETLAIFSGYMLFYVFAIRISGLKPIDSTMLIRLLTYLVAILAEEIYFRGQVFSFIEKRHSSAIALIVSAIMFGFFHVRQGISGMISKAITGLLWGSVRKTTGMIHLLIFPVHFSFNATWLLFAGNWDSPPTWAIYAFSAGELILTALVLVIDRSRKNSQ